MRKTTGSEQSRVPTSLAPILRDFVMRYGEPIRWARSERERPWVVLAEHHVGYLAQDGPSRLRLERERTRVEWASAAGVPIPTVVESSDSILVMERVADDPVGGHEYLALALAASERIAAAVPPELASGSGARSAPRRTLALRASRALAGGLDLRAFLRARSAVEALPRDQLSHGDFHPNNVLYDQAASKVAVIDWSYLGFQPAGSDLAYLWSRLPDPQDRAWLLHELEVRASDRSALAVVLVWIALRTLGDLLTESPIRKRNATRVAHARLVLAEAEKAVGHLSGSGGGQR